MLDHEERFLFREEILNLANALAEPGALDGVDRNLRLADEVVRHKLIRLPDAEAARRGLVGTAA